MRRVWVMQRFAAYLELMDLIVRVALRQAFIMRCVFISNIDVKPKENITLVMCHIAPNHDGIFYRHLSCVIWQNAREHNHTCIKACALEDLTTIQYNRACMSTAC